MDVYLEVGERRVFAVALDWPGLARAGRDEAGAMAALVQHAPRYVAVMSPAAADGPPPTDPDQLVVVERLAGDATTDFGAPGVIPQADRRPVEAAVLARLAEVMKAGWAAFDGAVEAAMGKELAPVGSRGGGRSLEKVVEHVAGAEDSYLRALGGALPTGGDRATTRQAFIEALGARARGELPDVGPRGGRRWPARYAVRRAAWHLLDHAWELEDRLAAG